MTNIVNIRATETGWAERVGYGWIPLPFTYACPIQILVDDAFERHPDARAVQIDRTPKLDGPPNTNWA